MKTTNIIIIAIVIMLILLAGSVTYLYFESKETYSERGIGNTYETTPSLKHSR